jgi:predicted metal-dependent phosphotriesterase family hydrolase
MFIGAMLDYGLTHEEIDTMTKKNPAMLLGL